MRSSVTRRAMSRPRQLSRLSLAVRFASGLYRERARIAGAGYLARDPMSLLKLRPGRENPYPVYERLRAAGPLVPTRQGSWACTSYHGCDTVLERHVMRGERLQRGVEAVGVEVL